MSLLCQTHLGFELLAGLGVFLPGSCLLIGLSGRAGGCLARILAVSVLSHRVLFFCKVAVSAGPGILLGSISQGEFYIQDLLGCSAFGVQHAGSCGLCASVLQNWLGLRLWCSPGFLICLLSAPPHPLEQSGVSGCCPSLPSDRLAFYSSL